MILHIETSSRTCSVALSSGAHPLSSLQSVTINDHSSALAPMIRDIMLSQDLRYGDLSAISISIGPGSYTGLRVGLSTAKALCYAIGCPLIAVDTLQSLVTASLEHANSIKTIFLPVLDARRQDSYLAVFDHQGKRLREDMFVTVSEDCLDAFLIPDNEALICGEGSSKWALFEGRRGIRVLARECHALNLVSGAWGALQRQDFADLSSCVPKYLKPPNITIPAKT